MIFLAELPEARTLVGAALVIGAVILHIGKPGQSLAQTMPLGLGLGIASAAFYAISYVLRRQGLERLPDPAFGTFIGAIAGMIWMLAANYAGPGRASRLRGLIVDRGPWHWLTALALSLGQISQFFALKSASVVVVATIGALEVFFAAVLGSLLLGGQATRPGRLWLPALVAVFDTGLLFS